MVPVYTILLFYVFTSNSTIIFITLRVDRVAKEDAVVEGVRIPKGAVVVVPLYALHHDPETWPDPEKFNPDRLVNSVRYNHIFLIATFKDRLLSLSSKFDIHCTPKCKNTKLYVNEYPKKKPNTFKSVKKHIATLAAICEQLQDPMNIFY